MAPAVAQDDVAVFDALAGADSEDTRSQLLDVVQSVAAPPEVDLPHFARPEVESGLGEA